MELIIALIASVAFTFALRGAIKACPVAFYALAVIVAALFASHIVMEAAPALGRTLYPYIQRCLFAFGLFAIVMFIGVFPDNSKVKRYLMPIRGELSIIAAILTAGHVINYIGSYFARFLQGFAGMPASMVASFAVSAVLIVLLVVLGVTSFNAVRKRMDAKRWKRIQVLAYPFFILVYAHLLLILAPSLSGVGQKAFFSVVVYTVLVAGYVVLRSVRAVLAKEAPPLRGEGVGAVISAEP